MCFKMKIELFEIREIKISNNCVIFLDEEMVGESWWGLKEQWKFFYLKKILIDKCEQILEML